MKTAKILIIVIILLLNLVLVYAHEQDFNEIKQLIDSGIGCNELSEEQLEMIGDYLMEQMHPGEQHETMDNALGGEGSENLKQAHIRMARMMYCGEMGNMMSMPMMGGGMMNMMMDGNMMGGNGMIQSGTTTSYQTLLNTLYLIFLVSLIILVWLGIIKLWKSNWGRNEKRR